MDYEKIIKLGVEITCSDINSRGSGFILRKDGLVGTNWHVVHDNNTGNQSTAISIKIEGFDIQNASIVISDRHKDFAILRVNQVFNDEPMLGDFVTVEAFKEVFFVGRALDVPVLSLHKGWTSAKTTKDGIDILQIDGPINQGNSGGAVFDNEGKIIGVITQTEAIFDKDLQNLTRLIPQLQGDVVILGIRLPETLRRIIFYLNRNRFVGIGYAFSIEYIKEALQNLT
jgi:S1-C subfamily serine protease